jgi:hypothetical protein
MRALSLGGGYEFIIKYCPATESILCDDSWPFRESKEERRARRSTFVQLAGKAKNLQYFELQREMSVEDTEGRSISKFSRNSRCMLLLTVHAYRALIDVVRFVPHVTTLALAGGFQARRPEVSVNNGELYG